jgi:hypothetical protein
MATCPACASGGYQKVYNKLLQENKIEMKCPVCTAIVENPAQAAAGTKTLVTELCTSMSETSISAVMGSQVAAIALAVSEITGILEQIAGILDISIELPNTDFGDIEAQITDAANAEAEAQIGRIIG